MKENPSSNPELRQLIKDVIKQTIESCTDLNGFQKEFNRPLRLLPDRPPQRVWEMVTVPKNFMAGGTPQEDIALIYPELVRAVKATMKAIRDACPTDTKTIRFIGKREVMIDETSRYGKDKVDPRSSRNEPGFRLCSYFETSAE